MPQFQRHPGSFSESQRGQHGLRQHICNRGETPQVLPHRGIHRSRDRQPGRVNDVLVMQAVSARSQPGDQEVTIRQPRDAVGYSSSDAIFGIGVSLALVACQLQGSHGICRQIIAGKKFRVVQVDERH